MTNFAIGEKVIYTDHYSNWQLPEEVLATVIGFTPKRIIITVHSRLFGDVEKMVKPDSLRKRNTAHPGW